MSPTTTSETGIVPLGAEEKAIYRARLRSALFHKLRALYRRRKREWGWTQRDLAQRVDTDPAVVSRRLKGRENVTLDWICDFARALDARVEVSIVPLSAVRRSDVRMSVWSQTFARSQMATTRSPDWGLAVASGPEAHPPVVEMNLCRPQ